MPAAADQVMESMSSVKVAFPFIHESVGGSHISALNLIRHLDVDRFEPLVLLENPNGRVADLFQAENIPFVQISKDTSTTDDAIGSSASVVSISRYGFTRVRAMAGMLRRHQARIVHTNDGRMHVFGGLAARLAGAKHVWHHRSDPDSVGLRYAAPAIANHLVTVSKFSGPKPGWWSAASKWSVVPSPFDTETPLLDRQKCRQDLLNALGAPADAAVIGFFANLTPRKRPLAFVRAVAALKAQKPEQPVIAPLFGKAFDISEDEVMALADELGVSDCIRVMGFLYPPDPWLAGCDIMFTPSVREPFGRTLIESMLAGTLVVATDSGGNPEAIEHGINGYLVPADDADAAASCMLEAILDPSTSKTIAERARDDALARFGMQRHAQSIMGIYDQLLQNPTRPMTPVSNKANPNGHL